MLPFELTPKQEKAKRTRLWKCYRWTLEMYNALGELQEWKCAGCGREAKTMPLNLDHKHFKIQIEKPTLALDHYKDWSTKQAPKESNKGWIATGVLPEKILHWHWGKTQKEARQRALEEALPVSVRGLLCPGRHGRAGQGCCNRLLGKVDEIWWLEAMANYLKNPPAAKLQDLINRELMKLD